jgi:manganese/zinc/iron transport system permease protein
VLHEFAQHLSTWSSLDTAIAASGALAAMSCALPGVWLVLRRHSMMGDALAHSALPGVVLAYIFAYSIRTAGWVQEGAFELLLSGSLMIGAVLLGVATAWLTEWVGRLGRLESGAALGVVFTSVFALGLLLIRLFADDVHIDPDCVLFGVLEAAVLETLPGTRLPMPAVVNGGMLLLNLALTLLFFKELRIAAFDPALAASLGVPARGIHYGLMAVTALTVVAAFESVGSILVIGLLIVPATSALLLSQKLSRVIILSLGIAALSAVLGHVLARTLPPIAFSRLGFPEVEDAGTAGMMAATAGLVFVATLLLAPRQGVIARAVQRLRLGLRIAGDDVLGMLYRIEEQPESRPTTVSVPQFVARQNGLSEWLTALAVRRLKRRQLVSHNPAGDLDLTSKGRAAAISLVRAHRLWEAYMARHFDLPDDHLHETAHRVEHVLDRDLQSRLDRELDAPAEDPHGRTIPQGSRNDDSGGESPGR